MTDIDIASYLPPQYLSPPVPQPNQPGGDATPTIRLTSQREIIPGSLRLYLAGLTLDNGIGDLYGSGRGTLFYASKQIDLIPLSIPTRGTTLTLTYLAPVNPAYEIYREQVSMPATDPVTHRASFSFDGPILPGGVEVIADLIPNQRNRLLTNATESTAASYWIVDRRLRSRDDKHGNIVARAPNFGKVLYRTGSLEIDTRFFIDPVLHFGLEYETRLFSEARTYDWTPGLTVRALPAGSTEVISETITITDLVIDLNRLDSDSATSTLTFSIGSKKFVGRNNAIYTNFSYTTGAETQVGTVDLSSNTATLTDW